ncbi:MAG: hypothetical protein H0U49_07150 [Parachlamydiaceae bacterium]|nr:hypothetical protein [Parachlamydiaceae bacterium]
MLDIAESKYFGCTKASGLSFRVAEILRFSYVEYIKALLLMRNVKIFNYTKGSLQLIHDSGSRYAARQQGMRTLAKTAAAMGNQTNPHNPEKDSSLELHTRCTHQYFGLLGSKND